MSALLIFVGLVILSLLLAATALWLAGRLLNYGKRGFGRAMLVAVMVLAIGLVLAVPQLFVPLAVAVAYSLLSWIAQLVVISLLIKRMQSTTTGRAWGGVGLLVASQVAYLAVALLIVRPFLLEAYLIPTNAMAPTLVAQYREDKCPACGGKMLVDEPSEEMRARWPRHLEEPPRHAICSKCFHEEDVPANRAKGTVQSADRIMVTKFLQPRRWDIVTYVAPNRDIFVKRLIGLPGEELTITSAGKVLIDGKDVGGPPEARTKFPWPPHSDREVLKPDVPMRLGADEYFVIGDNATHSYDSRFLGPVKRKDIVGVVSAIYWPMGRVRLVR